MPRRLRHWIQEGIYHLTVRGNDRQDIFIDDDDFQQYLILLRHCRDELPYRLLAYALMPNHVHLVVQSVPGTSFSTMMQRLGSNYAQYFNRRYDRVGHLYQGRFYSNYVGRESYLREVTRYVHLNPYRAALCTRPSDYAWSSYRVYISNEPDPLYLVEYEQVLNLFGDNQLERRVQYRQFVEDLVDRQEDLAGWLDGLHRSKVIPPRRWLASKKGV